MGKAHKVLYNVYNITWNQHLQHHLLLHLSPHPRTRSMYNEITVQLFSLCLSLSYDHYQALSGTLRGDNNDDDEASSSSAEPVFHHCCAQDDGVGGGGGRGRHRSHCLQRLLLLREHRDWYHEIHLSSLVCKLSTTPHSPPPHPPKSSSPFLV